MSEEIKNAILSFGPKTPGMFVVKGNPSMFVVKGNPRFVMSSDFGLSSRYNTVCVKRNPTLCKLCNKVNDL